YSYTSIDSPLNWSQLDIYNRDREWHEYARVSGWKTAEGDGVASRGLINYLGSRVSWDFETDLDAELQDFYTNAFGDASDEMGQYFEDLIYSPAFNSNYTLKCLYNDLNAAVDAAEGDQDVLDRIYFFAYYTKFLWGYFNIDQDNMTDEELKEFYTFCTQLRYLYVIFYKFMCTDISYVDNIYNELQSRGLTTQQILDLQNFTPPTEQDALDIIDEGLVYFNNLSASETIHYINPRFTSIEALGDTETSVLDPLTTHQSEILVWSDGNEEVTIEVKGAGDVLWFSPSGFWLDMVNVSTGGEWESVNFMTTDAAGYYILAGASTYQTVFGGSFKVPDRPAAMMASNRYLVTLDHPRDYYNSPTMWIAAGEQECYFYVPEGTDCFEFGATSNGGYEPYGTLTDPEDTEYSYDYAIDGASIIINNPVAGLWHLDIAPRNSFTNFWFAGIPPLVWYDPEYLLVPKGADEPLPNSAPVAQSQSINLDEDTLTELTLTAFDIDGDPLTYVIVTNPTHGSIFGTPPFITYTPNTSYNGTDSFTFKVNDGTINSNIATISITINPVDDLPIDENNPPIAYSQDITLDEDTSVEITLRAEDPENDQLSYSITKNPAHGNLSGTAPIITYTPETNFEGSDSISFVVSDGKVNSSTASVNILVVPVGGGGGPVVTPDPTAEEDSSTTISNLPPTISQQTITAMTNGYTTIILEASDPDGDVLVFKITSNPKHGNLSVTLPKVYYLPDPDYYGMDSFSYSVSDGISTQEAPVIILVTQNNNESEMNSLTFQTEFNSTPPSSSQTVNTYEDTSVPMAPGTNSRNSGGKIGNIPVHYFALPIILVLASSIFYILNTKRKGYYRKPKLTSVSAASSVLNSHRYNRNRYTSY
ncbi:Ig-like domain-containing protein, partial [Chloroflexota bacterium]